MASKQTVIFQAPFEVIIEESAVPLPEADQVLVQTVVSAISPGTELLFYRGQVPADMTVDATIEALAGQVAYPLSYGYALVGRIIAVGADVDTTWMGRRVFLFAPHQSHVLSAVDDLIVVPDDVDTTDAVLLPFMETAVSFLMDGQPMIGERVAVFGQGIIGLLTTAVLAAYPLSALVTIEPAPLRREWSARLGASQALDPQTADFGARLHAALAGEDGYNGADLVFELSGRPETLDQAIACAGFDARIVIGSWYGRKQAPIDLGGRFHRSQIRLISSQVSHIAPRWSGRFDKSRRLDVAWRMLRRCQPRRLITHRYHVGEAAAAYDLLHTAPETAIQVVFEYGSVANGGKQ